MAMLALVFAACGGSSNDSSTSSSGGASTGASASTTAASGGATTTAASGGDKSPIVLADLEGPAATGDPDFTKGMLVAQDEINSAGGIDGRQVQVKIIKKGLTPDSQVSVYRQAGADKTILAAWAAATGAVAMEAQSDRVQLPLVAVPGRIDFIKPPHKWVFSISADQAYPDAAVRWAVENKKVKKIAVLHYTEVDYSNGIVQSIKDRCSKTTEFGPPLGCTVVSEQTGKLTDTVDQLVPLLTKMKNSGADAYYIETLNPNGAKAARQLGMFNKPVLSEQWLSVPAIAAAQANAADDIVFSAQKCVAPDLGNADDPARKFCKDYKALYTKKYPSGAYPLFSVYGYDFVKLMAGTVGLMDKAGTPVTRENLVKALEGLKGQIRTSHGAVVGNPDNHRLTGKFEEAYFLYVIKTVGGKQIYKLAPNADPAGAHP
jgi:branched-chain amino acid transport system substrate-binding protein